MLDLYKLSRKILNQERMFKFNSLLAPFEYLTFRIITLNSVNQFKVAYKVYRESGLVPKNISSIIIKANFKTKGRIRNQILSSKVVTNPPPSSSIFSEEEITNALEDLRCTGFGKLGVINDPKLISDLTSLETVPVYSGQRYKASGRSEVELQKKPDIESDHIWYVQPETVLENVAVQKIISDPFWKYVSDNYLGSETHLTAIRCWHSFPPQKEFLSPENWHLDAADGLNFIKFFLLLTNVDMKSGPTAIVPVPSSKLPRKFYTGRRYTDQEVNKLLERNKKNILNATGSKGLIYVADTRLLHKGTPVVEGHRFILNWVSSVDSFGTVQSEKYKLKDNNLLKNRNDLIDI